MGDPILILGIAQRSGTNYLARVLDCHADCGTPSAPLNEDHLFQDADRLVAYAKKVSRRWPPEWGDSTATRAGLETELGQALLRFLESQTDKPRTVTKTPSLDGLERLGRLLPDTPVVVLVRDGRSVVASLMRGFHFSQDKAIRAWASGARALRHVQETGAVKRLLVVKYEDLLSDLDCQVTRILEFCELPVERFDMDAARSLPVTGSSFDRPAHGKLTWEPVERTAEFKAVDRHAGLTNSARARFDWLAGKEQAALGYPPTGIHGNRFPWLATNLGLDAVWPVRAVVRGGRDRVWVRVLRTRARWRAGDS